jgi:hypothetical protein
MTEIAMRKDKFPEKTFAPETGDMSAEDFAVRI